MFDLDLTIVFTNLNASAKLVKAVKAVKGAIVLSLTPFPLNIILIKVFRCNCISILAAGWLVVGWSLTQNRLTHWPLANTLWCYGVNSCQLWVGHMAWAPEGREEQSQKLEAYLSPQTHLSDPFFFKQIAEEKTDFATKLRKLGQNMKRYMWHGDLLCITQMMDVEEKCQISPHQSCNQRNQRNLSYRDIWNFSAWQIFSTGTTWQISGMARPTSVPKNMQKT